MNNVDKMKQAFEKHNRLTSELHDLDELFHNESTPVSSRKHLIKARVKLKRELSDVFSELIHELGEYVEEGFKDNNYKGVYRQADRFGVKNKEAFRKTFVGSLRQFFSMGYLRGYRQALRDSGQLD